LLAIEGKKGYSLYADKQSEKEDIHAHPNQSHNYAKQALTWYKSTAQRPAQAYNNASFELSNDGTADCASGINNIKLRKVYKTCKNSTLELLLASAK
jgi:hypothetical protein